MSGTYHPRRKVFNFWDRELEDWVMEKFPEQEWGYVIEDMRFYNKLITKSAIDMSRIMEREMGVVLFPWIHSMAKPHHGCFGQVKFTMYDVQRREYNFQDPVRDYKRKGARIFYEKGYGGTAEHVSVQNKCVDLTHKEDGASLKK